MYNLTLNIAGNWFVNPFCRLHSSEDGDYAKHTRIDTRVLRDGHERSMMRVGSQVYIRRSLMAAASLTVLDCDEARLEVPGIPDS